MKFVKKVFAKWPQGFAVFAFLFIGLMAPLLVPGSVTLTKHAAAQAGNLIDNAGVEQPAPADLSSPSGWNRGGYGNNNRQLLWVSQGHTGNRALGVVITAYSDGDAKWYFNDVAVEPGLTYEYESYYLSDGDTAITVRYTDQNGNERYGDFLSVPTANVWTKVTHRFTPPAGTKSLTVFHSLQSRGSLYTDDYSLKVIGSGAGSSGAMIAFAFDDGWSSHMDAGAILHQQGVPGTFFVVSQFLGQSGRLTFPNLQGLVEWGHEVGDHSASHSNLTFIYDLFQRTNEIVLSKLVIGRDIGIENVKGFAYPHGQSNKDTDDLVRAAYLYGRISEPGYIDSSSNRFQLPAMAVDRIANPDVVGTAKVWMDTAVLNGKLVIIFIHPVDFKKSQYSATPDELREMALYAKQLANGKKAKLVTVAEGVQLTFGL